jgi:hypothetical protein
MTKSKCPWATDMFFDDERLRRLVNKVWERLPASDRHVLRDLVSDISDHEDEDQSVLGSVGLADPSLPLNGNAGDIARSSPPHMKLGRLKHVESDQAVMFVIAHECAHVVLRHSEMSTTVGSLYDLDFKPPIYSEVAVAEIQELREDAADLQAYVWGFGEEMKAFHAAFPEARRSRWDVELQWELQEDSAGHSTMADGQPTMREQRQ